MTDVLLLAFIFLIAGIIAVPIASHLKLGSVLGYLIAGILISPLLAFLHVDVISIQHFAEFGVVMMLFLIGLELDPKLLWSMRGQLFGLGGGQVILSAGAVMIIAMILGQPLKIALAIGLVLALSSTAIVLQTLNEKGLIKSDGGQASFSVLLFQDIAVIPMLALIPLLAMPELIDLTPNLVGDHADKGTEHATSMSLIDGLKGWQTALVTISAIAAIIIVGNFLTGPFFRYISLANLPELFTATALMMVIGIALLMSLVGLSPALGTFLAGVVLANSEYRHELESDIAPFKGLLLGLFFMTVGASINFALLSENFASILALTIGLMTLKAIILLILGWGFKLKGADKWLLALGLSQAGEFGFVLLSFTVQNAVIPAPIADQLLLVVALSMLLTPLLFILYDRIILPRYNTPQNKTPDKIEKHNNIIIAGHGRVGGVVNRMLKGAGFDTTVIDFSSKQLKLISKFGFHAYFGDATRPDLLHSAGINQAKLFVIAIDDKEQITQLTKYAIKHYPHLHIIARAVNRNHVYELYAIGCRDIIRETYDSSIRMGRSAYEALGATPNQAERMKNTYDTLDRKRITTMAQHFDPSLPLHENETYMAKIRETSELWEKDLNDQLNKILKE